jgi:hypothetical protein
LGIIERIHWDIPITTKALTTLHVNDARSAPGAFVKWGIRPGDLAHGYDTARAGDGEDSYIDEEAAEEELSAPTIRPR